MAEKISVNTHVIHSDLDKVRRLDGISCYFSYYCKIQTKTKSHNLSCDRKKSYVQRKVSSYFSKKVL